jgi:DNA-binding GntR family transcriptional regulator
MASKSAGREGRKLSSSVTEELSRRIGDGSLPPGSQLPPEPALAAELGVSRPTLREALRGLQERGLLTRTPGAGTFVTHRARLRNNLDVNFGVTDAIRAAGMEPASRDVRVDRVPSSAEDAQQLALQEGDPLVAIDRVRTADGRPVVYSRDLFAASLADAARARFSARDWAGSIYDLFQRKFGIAIHLGVATFLPLTAPKAVAARLGVSRGALLLYLRQVDYAEDGRPVLYSHEYHLADAFEFTLVRRGPGRRAV